MNFAEHRENHHIRKFHTIEIIEATAGNKQQSPFHYITSLAFIKLKYGAFPDRPYDSKAAWGDALKITRILDTEH
jgi:hypothetical protein